MRQDGTDSVWGITRVKDEVDILAFTLSHMASEGLDGIFIVDNGSTDGTLEVIREFHDMHMPAGDPRDWGPPLVFVADDPDVAYYQSKKMTAMADVASKFYGADWIVPFDADELWCATDMPLGDYLRSLHGVDCVRATLYNHFPSSGDGDEPNPFERITWRDANPAPLPKVAVRWRTGMTINMGNHSADGGVSELKFAQMRVLHFPWRSPAQFVSKVRNGSTAINATDMDPAICGHWRSYGAILESSGEAAVEEIYQTRFNDPGDVKLVNEPAPFRRWAQ